MTIAQRPVPSTTIVTGAAGWLGTALVVRLAGEGRALRLGVLDDAERAHVLSVAPDAEVVVGDISAPGVAAELLAGAADSATTDVLHVAGIIHPRRVSDFERVNVGGTRAVLDAARRAGVRRLTHVSSNSPFGVNPTPTDVFGAEEPYRPWMGYGRSKMLAEQLVLEAHAAGDVEVSVVRPPWFYGPWQPERQTRFFTGVRTGRFPLVGDGSNRRSMAHVDNLVDGLVLASLVEVAAGRAYWIADRRPYPMREVVETVQQALRQEGYEVNGRIPRMPALAGTVAEKVDGVLQSRGIYHQEIHVLGEMDKTIACDISRAEQELGYDPRVELLDGMVSAIRWCRERGIEL
jgi:nucleoside-diphosphate-sugar epimerase